MEQGVAIRTVMEILSHSQISVTKRYLHVSAPMAQEAMQRMGDALRDWPEKRRPRNAKLRLQLRLARLGPRRKQRRGVT